MWYTLKTILDTVPHSMSGETLKPGPLELGHTQQIGFVRDGDTLFSIWKQDNLYTIRIQHKDHFVASLEQRVFDADLHAKIVGTPILQDTQEAQETVVSPEPEHLPIDIDGWIGRSPLYRDSRHPEHKGEKELSFPMSYRYDPNNKDRLVWYNIYVFGAKAEELYKTHQYVSGKAIRLKGLDYSYAKLKQEKKATVIREVHAHEVSINKEKRRITLTENDILDRDEILLGFRPTHL